MYSIYNDLFRDLIPLRFLFLCYSPHPISSPITSFGSVGNGGGNILTPFSIPSTFDFRFSNRKKGY